MIVRGTVEIDFEVPEGTSLDGTNVVLRAELRDANRYQLGVSFDCDTKSVALRFRQRPPRFLRESNGNYMYDLGLVDACNNHTSRFVALDGRVVADGIHIDYLEEHCTEVAKEDVPPEWLTKLQPEDEG